MGLGFSRDVGAAEKRKRSEPTLAPLYQKLVLFHARVGEARILTSPRS